MNRDEILAEMVLVAEALERSGLKPEQIARGRAKYDELETQFNALPEQVEMQRRLEEAARPKLEPIEQPKEQKQPNDDIAAREMAKIREILGEKK